MTVTLMLPEKWGGGSLLLIEYPLPHLSRSVFDRFDTGIVGSNLTRTINYISDFSVFVFSCVK
jgi:hypothetical protein